MTNNKLWVMFDTSTGLNLKRFTINLALSPISVSLDTTLSYTPNVNIYNGIEKFTSDGSIMLIAGEDRIYTASTISGGVISTTGSLLITGGSSRGGIALKNDYYVSITKTSGSNSWGDAQAYSTNGYVDRILISFKPNQTNNNLMIGLSSNQKPFFFNNIDYAWHPRPGSDLIIYENGSPVSLGGLTYTTDTILSIIYENNVVKYYKDGTLIRSVARNVGLPLYFDSALYELNSSFVLLNFNTFFNIGKNPNVVGTNVTITPSTSGTIYSTFTAGGVQSVYQNSSVLHNISSIVNPFAMSCDASFIYIFANDLVYRFTDSIPPQRFSINGSTDVVIPISASTQIFGVAQI
jgi:hypothetical protein